MTLQSLSNEELTQLWHKQAREMSFYNAAEGESWYRERSMRDACKRELGLTTEEIYSRGLTLPMGSYLV